MDSPNQSLPDGAVLYGVDFHEYVRAIEAAPPGTFIKVGELQPEAWVKCLGCGDEMTEPLSRMHACPTT